MTRLNPEFDWQAPALSGIQLIEASAGTGKTWTLTMLYVRLLLETALQPDNILVVTFTKAATAELKKRLRQRLSDTLTLLSEPLDTQSIDTLSQSLYQKYGANDYLLRKLRSALYHFDQAAIYTIHGFCQRVLTDHALRTQIGQAPIIKPDNRKLIKYLVDAFWQTHVINVSGMWSLFLYHQKINPEVWLSYIQPLLAKPAYGAVLPSLQISSTKMLEQSYINAYHHAAQAWQQDASSIQQLLLSSKLGYRTTYFIKLDSLLHSTPDRAWAFLNNHRALLQRFSAVTLAQVADEKNKSVPRHVFFHAVDDLLHCFQALHKTFVAQHAATLQALLQYCREKLPAMKREHKEMTYHDLLDQLDTALHHPIYGEKLSQLLQNRFGAALIDEFQDTDPLQYRIFSQIYANSACPVFLIGDPKQAIYNFRGADIHTYLTAQSHAQAYWTLQKNYRSTAALLNNINQLFSRQITPFWLPKLSYHCVTAPDPCSLPVFHDPLHDAALQCWKFLQKSSKESLSKEAAAYQAIEATAREIKRLLSEATIDEQPILASDIAVLVPSHYYASKALSYFVSEGISAVHQGTSSVLTSTDAVEWLRILHAFLNPHHEGLRKNALTTYYMGIDAHQLLALVDNEVQWEKIAMQFINYHQLWQEHGIMRAFRAWLSDWEVTARLMLFPDGLRKITNLRHLIEILQQKSQDFSHLNQLTDWFAQEIAAPTLEEDAIQLRLDSDTVCIKIMTIHAAKGLEFAIVFCPFLWHSSTSENSVDSAVVFHDETGQSHLDFGSIDQPAHRLRAEEAQFSEKLRLLYVALTRAKYRNYICWGRVSGVEKAALSWLLYGKAPQSLPDFISHMNTLDDAHWWQPWQTLAKTQVSDLPVHSPVAPKCCAPLSPSAPAPLSIALWSRPPLLQTQITSFSALIARQHHAPLIDSTWYVFTKGVEEDTGATISGLAKFPTGARTGLCWHRILENWDFQPNASFKQRIIYTLRAYGFAVEWVDSLMKAFTVLSQVRVATRPLSAVLPHQRVSELAFTFRFAPFNTLQLAQVLQQHGAEGWAHACARLSMKTITGMMTGFIDLIVEDNDRYFIIDYKSNYLGDYFSDYHFQSLDQTMVSQHYYLQYLIYIIALHRYLKQRLATYHYEKHIGGVVYIFLRGICPGLELGIFRNRPDWALIQALEALLNPTFADST